MVLGPEWDQYITHPSAASDALALIMNHYSVTSIQSLTYSLNLNLADVLSTNQDANRRFQSLAYLGELLKCRVFVLGSPGQKKLNALHKDPDAAKKQFIENCAWMASVLAPNGILSLEHNTNAQGAQFCNTLRDIVDVIFALRRQGVPNVGLNLDTKCLIHEFGNNVILDEIVSSYALESFVVSIQVSLDFLARYGTPARSDEKRLLRLAKDQCCPVSLEEFGLLDEQLSYYIHRWRATEHDDRIHCF
jgi:hypothetical protein